MKTIKSVSHACVDIRSGFWKERQTLNREVTVRAVLDRFAETGRFQAFKCGWREGQPGKPHIFWDSDIAKWMEAVAYLVQKAPAPEYEKVVEETIDEIERHQDENGYVNSYFTSVEPAKRWTQRWAHELYCAGHLIEAAIAWREATGRDRFLNIMCRYADYIYRVFAEEESASFDTPGHEEIELALVKLYHATNNEKYLSLSRLFINRRGTGKKDLTFTETEWSRYADQTHLPARLQTTAEGHAVRAGYFYSAMADLAREDGDEELKSACERIFDNIVSKRMYVTGGVGSTHHNEAFTVDYDLPNQTSYTETCASIALAYFAGRMLTLDTDSKYADAIERVLYNGFLSGTSLDGKKFFYSNPLEIDVSRRCAHPSSEHGDWLPATQRVEVFSCSCCPPNVARFVASVGDFMFTEDENAVYLHQYMDAHAIFGAAEVSVGTRYPAEGTVCVTAKGLGGRKLALRIPGWCASFTLSKPYELRNGYAYIEGPDEIDAVLTMDMRPQLIEANPNVADAAGKVCVMRGPMVYCAEGVDNGPALTDVRLNAQTGFEETSNEEYGVPVLTARGVRRPSPKGEWLYRRFDGKTEDISVTLIPYFAFANRGESDMRVWIPVKN